MCSLLWGCKLLRRMWYDTVFCRRSRVSMRILLCSHCFSLVQSKTFPSSSCPFHGKFKYCCCVTKLTRQSEYLQLGGYCIVLSGLHLFRIGTPVRPNSSYLKIRNVI